MDVPSIQHILSSSCGPPTSARHPNFVLLHGAFTLKTIEVIRRSLHLAMKFIDLSEKRAAVGVRMLTNLARYNTNLSPFSNHQPREKIPEIKVPIIAF